MSLGALAATPFFCRADSGAEAPSPGPAKPVGAEQQPEQKELPPQPHAGLCSSPSRDLGQLQGVCAQGHEAMVLWEQPFNPHTLTPARAQRR